jgi:putative tryptophan/tyrosine transport system substrate-binding protein
MKRRDVIVGLAGAVAMHGFAHPQGRSGLHHIAILLAIAEADPFLPRFIEAAQQGLQSFGWKLESSLHIEVRVAGFDPERLKKYAEEVVALGPEVILVLSTAEIRAVRKENATVPIVFAYATDPVADGVVESLARPGGHTTGFTNYEPSIATKWLGLLKEMAPALKRVAMVLNVESISLVALRQAVVAAAPSFDLTLTTIGDTDSVTITGGIESFASGDAWSSSRFSRPIDRRSSRPHCLARGAAPLAGYLPVSRLRESRRADVLRHRSSRAVPPCRVLCGSARREAQRSASAGAGKFDLILNNKTARTIGIPVPATLLASADEVIE